MKGIWVMSRSCRSRLLQKPIDMPDFPKDVPSVCNGKDDPFLDSHCGSRGKRSIFNFRCPAACNEYTCRVYGEGCPRSLDLEEVARELKALEEALAVKDDDPVYQEPISGNPELGPCKGVCGRGILKEADKSQVAEEKANQESEARDNSERIEKWRMISKLLSEMK